MSTRGFEVLVIGSGGLVKAGAQRAFQLACVGGSSVAHAEVPGAL